MRCSRWPTSCCWCVGACSQLFFVLLCGFVGVRRLNLRAKKRALARLQASGSRVTLSRAQYLDGQTEETLQLLDAAEFDTVRRESVCAAHCCVCALTLQTRAV